MTLAHVSTVDLYWESFGEGPLVLLVMGIGSQGILWPVAFCEGLAARGFRVVRFDHRDVGLSSRLDALGRPRIRRTVARRLLGRPTGAPYGLDDMADDAIGLVEALGAGEAHLVGASMGGMIAQIAAIRHPGRVRSLVSIMSTPGRLRDFAGGDPRALLALMRRPGPGREGFVDHMTGLLRALNGADPFDEPEVRALAGQVWDRGAQGDGWFRHFAAIVGARDRRADLARLDVPALVIHGTADPLVPVRAGRATAAAIPGARFLPIDGMGHALPRARWPALIDAIAVHAGRADAARAGVLGGGRLSEGG